MIEAPPPPPNRSEIIERREIIIDKAPSEVPRSVREWDAMSGAVGGGGSHAGGKSDRGHSEHDHSEHGSSRSTVKGHRKSERSPSPSETVTERKSSKSHQHSRSRSHGGHSKAEYVEEEDVGESNAMTTGPLALVLPHRSKSRRGSRDERKIKEEIRELEAEKKRLREERKHEKKHHKHHGGRSDSDEEVIIERRDGHGRERDVKIEKDRKGNMAFVR